MTQTAGHASLPTGTVAFLMTDIDGSTQLVARLGDAWPGALDRHFGLMRSAVGAHGGTWVSSEGDAVFAVFPSVRQAIAAAVQAQREHASAQWPRDERIKVRMAVHVGEAVRGGRDYTGIDVHRTARLAAAGHGGQLLISESARSLVGDQPAEGLTVHDLGVHQLRDMPSPERIFQIAGPGLEPAFAPLRTQTRSTPTNLPAPLTRFVGRESELVEVGELLRAQRLVTLTGPGGTGKTRLSIEVARARLDDFPEGVWFVALDVVLDPALVIPTIAATLAVREQPGRSWIAALAERLAAGRTLLVLDNLEQVISAAPALGELLAAAPGVSILASSREPLAIAGEFVYPVPPLSVPDEPGRPTAVQIENVGAIALFVERAKSVRPDFRLTDSNAPIMAAISRRLDGLPLALELAAARSNVLSPDQILSRLDRRLTLLASSRRDLPERQRTLRGAIDWSHDLLGEPEKAVFRRFAVFAGGADFDSVQQVVDPSSDLPADLLDLMSALVDRSLLVSAPMDGGNRLTMLETIREYATEQLAASGEERTTRDRHAARFLALARPARNVLAAANRDDVLDRLDRELPNLRAALAWSLEGGDYATGLEIAICLHAFLHVRSHLGEGRAVLAALLDASAGEGVTPIRVEGVVVAAELASWQGDFAAATSIGATALEMADELGDEKLLAAALGANAWGAVRYQPELARDQFNRAIALLKSKAAQEGGSDVSLLLLAGGAMGGLSLALLNLGDEDGALRVTDESIELAQEAGDTYGLAYAQLGKSELLLRRGDTQGALTQLREAVTHFRRAHAAAGIALALDAFATIAIRLGDGERGARLGAVAQRIRTHEAAGTTPSPIEVERPLEQARKLLTADEFKTAIAVGESMDIEAAVAEAEAIGSPR